MNENAIASRIYNDLIDMDYMDYAETRDHDISHIESMIRKYGYLKTLTILTDYPNN